MTETSHVFLLIYHWTTLYFKSNRYIVITKTQVMKQPLVLFAFTK